MPKENFIDRLNTAQQNINNDYQNEEQKKAAEVRRELEGIGVISAFQELIDNKIIATEKGSDKPIHIEYGCISPHSNIHKGYFLVFNDKYHEHKDSEHDLHVNIRKDAIGVIIGEVYPVKKYEVGRYQLVSKCSNWERSQYNHGYNDIGQKWHLNKDQVLDELANIVAIFKHNQKVKETGSSNFLIYP